ncbi:PREDICTED: colipase [Merops nubicus]|uniref:colipase n=1 Tax=Merops nubicus TaxID=57421 RepID=UPI0004F03328|nr:PREDICTED: colipase [Merops nubicus]
MANVLPSCLLLVLLLLAPALPAPHERGLILNLSIHCKSGFCHRKNGLSLARCAMKAAETQECSPKSLYGVYYKRASWAPSPTATSASARTPAAPKGRSEGGDPNPRLPLCPAFPPPQGCLDLPVLPWL